jgi:hypothetical protein
MRDKIKARILDELEMRGWTIVEGTENLIPPDSLWEKKPKEFFVYDAVDVEELLNKEFFEKVLMEEGL